MTKQKRILSFGGGVDSSAILLRHLMVEDLGIDAVVFADTGAESRGTYENVRFFQNLCSNQSLPFHVVSNKGETITDWVTKNGTVPVMAGGKHVCSKRFKGDVIAKWVKDSFPAGTKITYLIGIEADEQGRKDRFTKPKGDSATYEYPLMDRGLTRQDCLNLIENFGLSIPKSSCVFCPFMSAGEIADMRRDPEAWATIKLVESRFQEESPIKHQRWLDAGKPLIMLRTTGWKDGEGEVTPAKGDIGDHCKIGYRAPNGMWQHDSWANGVRLYAKTVGGKQLSVSEWESVLDSEEAAA